MKYPYAIFDMDGTLLDSMRYWRNLGTQYLQMRGITVPQDLQEVLQTKTMEEGARYFREYLGLTESVEEIVDGIYALIVDNYRLRIEAKPGVKDFLEQLKSIGVKMCIATATFDYVAMPALERLGLLPYFEFVMDCRGVGGKSTPDVYDAAAARLGGNRANTMIFEDAPHAIRTAHRAGYYVVGVREQMMRDAEDAVRATTDYFIEDFQTTDFVEKIKI